MGLSVMRLKVLALVLLSTASAVPEVAQSQSQDRVEAMFTCPTAQSLSLCCKQTVQADGTASECEPSMQIVLGQGDTHSLTVATVHACSAQQQHSGYLNMACCESEYQRMPENSTFSGAQCTHASFTNIVHREATLGARSRSQQIESGRLLNNVAAAAVLSSAASTTAAPPLAARKPREGVLQGMDAPRGFLTRRMTDAEAASALDMTTFLLAGQRQANAQGATATVPTPDAPAASRTPIVAWQSDANNEVPEAASDEFVDNSSTQTTAEELARTAPKVRGLAAPYSPDDKSTTSDSRPEPVDVGEFIQDTTNTESASHESSNVAQQTLPNPSAENFHDCVPDDFGMCVRNPKRVILRRSRITRSREVQRQPTGLCRLGTDGKCVVP